jgi:hypothetical protein
METRTELLCSEFSFAEVSVAKTWREVESRFLYVKSLIDNCRFLLGLRSYRHWGRSERRVFELVRVSRSPQRLRSREL